MLNLYNTESRTKELIGLPEGQESLTMYTCGPTVYNYAHIGNLRTYVFEDLLRRTIKYFGFPLIQAMNLTDVEDKTIKGALEEGIPLTAYTQRYKEAFFEDLKTLHIEPVEIVCSATDSIAEMIEMIETLLEKGIAYKGKDGGIYYSTKHFPSYGRLSHLKLEDLKEGASERVSEDEHDKESASDFVLWKPYDQKRDEDVFWESPFGKGRPGWHIECSAMATHYLGETIDLHIGGVDNIFPHHENEIAQSEGCSGKHFVRHWMHAQHLIVDGEKMSKSLGNFYTLRDLLAKGYTGEEVRYLLLSTHYRTQLNFTFEGLNAARQTLTRFSDFVHRLRNVQGNGAVSLDLIIEQCRTSFKAALGDDLNISVALASLFEMIKQVNALIDEEKVSKSEAEKVLAFLEELSTVLAVLPLQEKEVEIPPEIQEAFEKRQATRASKDWAEADKQRVFIQSQGFIIEDSPSGSRVKKQ
ncbi:MAG: cysteine--tRNA ligase [Candidatus Neptunochlamydia sp.]|nr:cysteine--tRNA ligase [Candidatus Neptunochlamydia sp.]